MKRLSWALLVLSGCASGDRLVADYGPERRFVMPEGTWVTGAGLQNPADTTGHFTHLDSGEVVAVVNSTHEVVRFAREDDDHVVRLWIELEGDRIAAAAFWAREWDGETTWFWATKVEGTAKNLARSEKHFTGTLDLTFTGVRESARGGQAGPLTFRVAGDFRAELTKAR